MAKHIMTIMSMKIVCLVKILPLEKRMPLNEKIRLTIFIHSLIEVVFFYFSKYDLIMFYDVVVATMIYKCKFTFDILLKRYLNRIDMRTNYTACNKQTFSRDH